MLFALADGARRQPSRSGERAACPECQRSVIGYCGAVVTWHWKHAVADGCCYGVGETEWHRAWKALAPPDCCEVVLGGHRADMLLPNGTVVEFQNSNISIEDIRAREAHYEWMIWIVSKWRRGFFSASKPVLIDLGDTLADPGYASYPKPRTYEELVRVVWDITSRRASRQFERAWERDQAYDRAARCAEDYRRSAAMLARKPLLDIADQERLREEQRQEGLRRAAEQKHLRRAACERDEQANWRQWMTPLRQRAAAALQLRKERQRFVAALPVFLAVFLREAEEWREWWERYKEEDRRNKARRLARIKARETRARKKLEALRREQEETRRWLEAKRRERELTMTERAA